MKEFLVSFFLFLVLLATVAFLSNKEPQVITKVITKEVKVPADTEKLKEENAKLKKKLQTERQLRDVQRVHYQQYVNAYQDCQQYVNSLNCH